MAKRRGRAAPWLAALAIVAAACSSSDGGLRPVPTASGPAATATVATGPGRTDPIEARIDALLGRMTLAEKIGQMTQVDRSRITPADLQQWGIGSVLSGGGSTPTPNTVESWAAMTDGYQQAARASRLGIPVIYGIDAVHGHNSVHGATMFPHNIGLGAANDPSLVARIARATALEMAATGVGWSFSPVVAVPQDIRWGRTYEAYSEDPAIVATLGAAHVRGLQEANAAAPGVSIVATAKHFIGDGAAGWGTSMSEGFIIDQGDARIDEAELRAEHLPPYQAALDADVGAIMVSFSSWNGTKMHAHRYLLTEVLKGELGFDGVVLSDWAGIDQIPGDYASDVVTAINAGIDMVMVPVDYPTFIGHLTSAVQSGLVAPSRIDDATRRILRLKFATGLFEPAPPSPDLAAVVGSPAHRQLAREAVQRSLVLLKNDDHVLPLDAATPRVLVAGSAADDIGLQSGGWTITQQGQPGAVTPGTTILAGIAAAVAPTTVVDYDPAGRFDQFVAEGAGRPVAEVGIVVLAEPPYAEGAGDRADLALPPQDLEVLARVRPLVEQLVVVLLSGRPLVVTPQLPDWEAFVAAWLPGTEGNGVSDVLFGAAPFTGRLPSTWPRWTTQLPLDDVLATGCEGPLFVRGFGLATGDPSPPQIVCPTP